MGAGCDDMILSAVSDSRFTCINQTVIPHRFEVSKADGPTAYSRMLAGTEHKSGIRESWTFENLSAGRNRVTVYKFEGDNKIPVWQRDIHVSEETDEYFELRIVTDGYSNNLDYFFEIKRDMYRGG